MQTDNPLVSKFYAFISGSLSPTCEYVWIDHHTYDIILRNAHWNEDVKADSSLGNHHQLECIRLRVKTPTIQHSTSDPPSTTIPSGMLQAIWLANVPLPSHLVPLLSGVPKLHLFGCAILAHDLTEWQDSIQTLVMEQCLFPFQTAVLLPFAPILSCDVDWCLVSPVRAQEVKHWSLTGHRDQVSDTRHQELRDRMMHAICDIPSCLTLTGECWKRAPIHHLQCHTLTIQGDCTHWFFHQGQVSIRPGKHLSFYQENVARALGKRTHYPGMYTGYSRLCTCAWRWKTTEPTAVSDEVMAHPVDHTQSGPTMVDVPDTSAGEPNPTCLDACDMVCGHMDMDKKSNCYWQTTHLSAHHTNTDPNDVYVLGTCDRLVCLTVRDCTICFLGFQPCLRLRHVQVDNGWWTNLHSNDYYTEPFANLFPHLQHVCLVTPASKWPMCSHITFAGLSRLQTLILGLSMQQAIRIRDNPHLDQIHVYPCTRPEQLELANNPRLVYVSVHTPVPLRQATLDVQTWSHPTSLIREWIQHLQYII